VRGATVFLYTARPKKGPAYLCPSCYPDCGRYGRTGADGRFRIGSVNGALLFRVVVVAEGYEPGFFKDVEAARGPWRAVLSRRRQSVPSEHLVRGRMVGPADYDGAIFVRIRRTGTWERLENAGFGAPLIVPDRSGRFEVKRFPPGPAIVQVCIPTKLPNSSMEILEQVFQRRLDLPPGAEVDLGEMRWEMPDSHKTHDR